MPETTWSSSAITHTGKVRTINQDAYINLPTYNLWAVADGMGGHQSGELASRSIVKALAELRPAKTLGITVKNIYHSLNQVNQTLIEYAQHRGYNNVIGSTVAVLTAQQHFCVALWSGDSRIYLFRRGQLQQISRDHNNAANLLANGVLPEDIQLHPYAQTLTHAIGGEATAFLDAQLLQVAKQDIFLLCSDGLTKEITDTEIQEILRTRPFHRLNTELMELALARGGHDNITLVLNKFCG